MAEQTWNIEEFNPTKHELTELAKKYKGMKIKDLNDEKEMKVIKDAKKDLASRRIHIVKTLKTIRDWAIQFQRDCISKEKELVSIIDDVESSLKAELERVKLEKEMENRKEYLPIMKQEIWEMWLEYWDEFLLTMNYWDFQDFLSSEKARLFEENQQRIKEKEEKEAREIELENVRKNAIIAEKERAEKEKKEAQEKIEIEKIQIEQKHKEEIEKIKRDQQEKELREKIEKENEIKRKKEAQEKIEKEEKYNNWLTKNSYNEKDFIVLDKEGKKKMYKFVSEY